MESADVRLVKYIWGLLVQIFRYVFNIVEKILTTILSTLWNILVFLVKLIPGGAMNLFDMLSNILTLINKRRSQKIDTNKELYNDVEKAINHIENNEITQGKKLLRELEAKHGAKVANVLKEIQDWRSQERKRKREPSR